MFLFGFGCLFLGYFVDDFVLVLVVGDFVVFVDNWWFFKDVLVVFYDFVFVELVDVVFIVV